MDPLSIVNQMMANDAFSKWMGIEIEEVQLGFCQISMKVVPEMLNGFNILHGGVTFAFADSCFAFASNSRGYLSVSLQASISFPNIAKECDVLVAESKEISLSKSSAIYDIEVKEQQTGNLIGVFRGVAHRKMEKPWQE
jgi:acyl-CoA thioesterase